MIEKLVFKKEANELLKQAGYKARERNEIIKAVLENIKPKDFNQQLEEWLKLANDFQKRKQQEKEVPLESVEQKAVVKWFKNKYGRGPLSNRIVMIRNDGTRTASEKTDQLLLGLCPGAADLYIPHLSLWLEMKRVKNSTQTKRQKDFEAWVKSIGQRYEVGYGHADAIRKIKDVIKEVES